MRGYLTVFAVWTVVMIPAVAGGDTCPPAHVDAVLDLVRVAGGVPAVEVSVGGNRTQFLLSTDAGQSGVSAALANQLHLPRRHAPAAAVNRLGNASNDVAMAHDVRLGAVGFASVQFRIMASAPPPQMPQGVLGEDLLRTHDVELDFAARKLKLISRAHCSGDSVVDWPSATMARLPMRIDDNNHIRFSMTLDRHELETVLDTGAPHSAMNLAVAKQVFDVDESSPGSVPVRPGAENSPYHHRFGLLQAADVTIRNPDILLTRSFEAALPGTVLRGGDRFRAGLRLHEPDLRLGMSSLRQLHIYIDYYNQTIYLTPAK